MSLFLDEKYIGRIAYLLGNFRKKSDHLWNFRCPICGDSKKNTLKARGYLIRAKEGLIYKCHNCGCSCSFSKFLEQIDPNVFKEYMYDRFLEHRGGEREPESKKEKQENKTKAVKAAWKTLQYKAVKLEILEEAGCVPIASLKPEHPARVYLEGRKIPKKFLAELYWTEDFPVVVDKVCVGHQFKLRKEGRIVIPFLDRKNKIVAIQGRSLNNDGIRYITIKTHDDASRIYGLHRLTKTYQRIYTVEGPFDSLFLPNCVALAGSDIPAGFPVDKTIIVYDNERRKADTVAKMEKAIAKGYRVCIWPDTITEKDINLMVLSGHSPAKIRSIIDNNSYSGLEAKLRLQHWAKHQPKVRKGNAQHTDD